MSDPEKRKWQETAQREPQQIIAAILDAVPARIFWKDLNSVYLGCNAPFARDAGFARPEELIGKDDYQMGWREQAEIYRADDRAVMETGRAKLLIDEPQTTPDGKTIRLLTSKVPLRDSKGQIFGVLGTYLDVTERARLQEQLSFTNLLLKTGVENAPDAVIFVDANEKIIAFNRNFIELWQIPEKLMVVGATYEPVVRLMTEQATSGSVIIAGMTQLQERPGEAARGKLTLKDGRVIDWHTAPLREAHHKYLGRIWFYRDVTEQVQANRQIETQNLLFEAALNNMAQGLLMYDASGKLIVSNRRFAELWGLAWEKWKAAARGLTVPETMQLGQDWSRLGLINRQKILAEHRALIERRQSGRVVFERSDGHTFSAWSAPMRDGGFVITFEDITEQVRANKQIETQNLQFEAALNNMAQGLLMYDPAGKLIVCNRRLAELVGVDWERWIGAVRGATVAETLQAAQTLSGLPATNAQQVIAEQRHLLDHREAGRIVIERVDGHIFSARLAPMRNGGLVVTLEDITEQRRTEEKISHLAHFDGLTDLPNRAHFYDEMDALLKRLPQKESFAVLSLDLDHFKSVNDTLGHPFGDRLLQIAAARMRSSVRESDLVARLGGDEFAVLLATFKQPADATALAARLIESLSAPFEINDHQVVVGVSVGIAIAPADGASADLLMRNADLALYRCKADGGNMYRFFEAEMDARMQTRRAIELDLRKALTGDEFTLVYQPIVKLKNGRVSACEALIRWHNQQRGWVEPREFIPVAEECGLIIPIGEWVLMRACTDAKEWPSHISVAVNISPVQFRAPEFVNVVKSALAKTGLPAHRLELEITELVLIQESEAALAKLKQFKDLGVSIAMDDFGTGYSSLGYLRSFPFDRIKVDQSFVRDVTTNKESLAILRAVVGLGSSLNIITTAEGVETRDQLDLLRNEGCTDVQGYLFSRPIPAGDVKGMLASLEGNKRESA